MISPSEIFTIISEEDRTNAIALFLDKGISGVMFGETNFVTCVSKEDDYIYIKKYTFTGVEYIMEFGVVIPVDQWYKDNGVESLFKEYINGGEEETKIPYITKDGVWSTGEKCEIDPGKLV